jgi:hypothetical protein
LLAGQQLPVQRNITIAGKIYEKREVKQLPAAGRAIKLSKQEERAIDALASSRGVRLGNEDIRRIFDTLNTWATDDTNRPEDLTWEEAVTRAFNAVTQGEALNQERASALTREAETRRRPIPQLPRLDVLPLEPATPGGERAALTILPRDARSSGFQARCSQAHRLTAESADHPTASPEQPVPNRLDVYLLLGAPDICSSVRSACSTPSRSGMQ